MKAGYTICIHKIFKTVLPMVCYTFPICIILKSDCLKDIITTTIN